jgi:hypothetical protein
VLWVKFRLMIRSHSTPMLHMNVRTG